MHEVDQSLTYGGFCVRAEELEAILCDPTLAAAYPTASAEYNQLTAAHPAFIEQRLDGQARALKERERILDEAAALGGLDHYLITLR